MMPYRQASLKEDVMTIAPAVKEREDTFDAVDAAERYVDDLLAQAGIPVIAPELDISLPAGQITAAPASRTKAAEPATLYRRL